MRIALAAAAVVLAAAPGIGRMRGLVQQAFPDAYWLLLVSVVGAAILGAVAWAVRTVRDRHASRYGLIAAAVAIGVSYSTVMATGNADVDAVERFHFVEYGGLTFLFHRAWRDRPRREAIALPFLAVFLVGTLDEWIQWFVPGRVGEWRDVLLNSVAIVCGLLFAAGLAARNQLGGSPSPRIPATQGSDPGSDPWILPAMAVATAATFGAFFYAVHVGYEVYDSGIGSFRSRYSAQQLLALAERRTAEWRAAPPRSMTTYSREDQYLAEALWHIQRRNEMEGEGGIWATWKENLILEKYFAPVLEFPTYRTPDGARWPEQRRANVAAVSDADPRPFVSDAHPFPIYPWLGR